MDFGINGRTALVLGAGGGLGSAIASTLAKEGVNVALADRDVSAVEEVAENLKRVGAKAIVVPWDLADRSGTEGALARIEASLGAVDILVNNTGGPPPGPIGGQAPEAWLAQFESMVLSVIHLTDLVVPRMREKGWGRVITSSSSGVIAPIPHLGTSNTLRSALVGWSKTLAAEVAPDGVTVNIVVPGRVATNRIKSLDAAKAKRDGLTADQIAAASAASIPIGRYGSPQEYANVVAFLASACASYVTGSVIRVDGGLISSV